jgi:methenyltetrahydromethanopterin cyclohydrolase
MADLATVQLVPGRVGDVAVPAVAVSVTHPVAACMASQYAGWQVKLDKFFAMGSGPFRAAYGKEDLYDRIGFREKPMCAVGILETSSLPGIDVVTYVAGKCGVKEELVTLIAARTASLAGGVQVVARSVETAMHKLDALGYPLRQVVGGFGTAPVPPVAKDDLAAIGRTNDAVLYAGEVTLYVTGSDDDLGELAQKLPSQASRDYGEPFARIFKRYDHDFYKIDPMLFSPATVSIQNVQTGRVFNAGRTNHEVLAASFFGE